MRAGEHRGVAEVAGFLFEATPGALKRPTLHKVVDGVGILLGGADSGDIRKEAKEMFEEDGGRIESPIEEVGERGGESVGGVVWEPKLKPSSAWRMTWLIVRTKSGIARVDASMNPRPPWAMVMYAISRESRRIEVRHVR